MRLTTKELIDDTKTDGILYLERYKKLSQLEDIEDDIGIDLVTLFNVLKNGTYVYYKKGKKIERGVINHFLNVPNAWYITICGNDKFYSTRKYGKTWALTKEELEK